MDGERDVAGGVLSEGGGGDGDAFTRRMLAGELAARVAIKQEAYRNGLGAGSGRRRHTLYVHLTDRTLATGNGVVRVEELGPLLAGQLAELLGHDQIIVKPVIDLQDEVNVHSYEIPDRIGNGFGCGTRWTCSRSAGPRRRCGWTKTTSRRRTRWSTRTNDHRQPHTAGQTPPPCEDLGGWRSRRLPSGAVAWISPHGFRFVVDHVGTHPVPRASIATEFDAAAGM